MSFKDFLRSQYRLAVLSWGGVGLLRLAEYSMDNNEKVRHWADRWLSQCNRFEGMGYATEALPILLRALEHEDKNTRDAAMGALEELGWGMKVNPHLDIEKLDEMQELIEKSIRKLEREKQNEEKSRIRVKLSSFLINISKKKAMLSKDGELLTGETIKPPNRSRGNKNSRKYMTV